MNRPRLIIAVVIGVIIVGILAYFLLNQQNKSVVTVPQNNTSTSRNTPPRITIQPAEKDGELNQKIGLVVAVSNDDQYKVNGILRVDELQKVLKRFSLYGRNYSYEREGNTNGKPLQRIIAHLVTDQSLVLREYDLGEGGGLVYREGMTITPGTFDVWVYIDPTIIQKEQPKAERLFLGGLIISAYVKANNIKELTAAQKTYIKGIIDEASKVTTIDIL